MLYLYTVGCCHYDHAHLLQFQALIYKNLNHDGGVIRNVSGSFNVKNANGH
jgi:hypothetical protein